MKNLPETTEISIARGQILRFDEAQGLVLRVREGELWITQDREGADHLLATGSSFRIERHGRTLVSALRSSRFQVCSTRPAVASAKLSLAAS